MPREESPYAIDWLRIAEKDLERVERMLEDDDPEMAGFCLQQQACIEREEYVLEPDRAC